MEILRFEGAPNSAPKGRKKKSNLRTLAGLASVAAIAVLGATLAANITLGTGSLEFGQGVQITAACDSTITVTPTSTFTNAAGGGAFHLTGIGISGFDDVACAAKIFSLNAYGNSNATPLVLATTAAGNSLTTATFALASYSSGTVSVGATISAITGNSGTAAFTLTLTTPAQVAGDVYKLTLQSS